MSDADQVQALVDFAVERFGGLDIMFNNAGIGSPLKRFLPDDLEDFSRIMNVNLFGVIVGSQRAARYMKDHGGGSHHQQCFHRSHQRRRRHDLLPGVEGGHCPRHEVHGHRSRALRHPGQLHHACPHPHGITTYEMGPVLRYMQPLEREAQPEDVANAVVFLASDRAAQITGIVLPIDGGTTAGPPYAQTKLIMSTAAHRRAHTATTP